MRVQKRLTVCLRLNDVFLRCAASDACIKLENKAAAAEETERESCFSGEKGEKKGYNSNHFCCTVEVCTSTRVFLSFQFFFV